MSGALQAIFANFKSSGAAPSFATLITSPTDSGKGITKDSLNNVIVVNGYSIHKFDSSGTLLWAKGTVTDGYMTSVVVDSTDNIYAAGNLNAGVGFIIKFNSSGVVQWQRTQTPPATSWYARSIYWKSIEIDSSNNIYVGGTYYSNNQQTACCCGSSIVYKYEFGYLAIAKYDSSGNFQWARKFGSDNETSFPVAELSGWGLCLDSWH